MPRPQPPAAAGARQARRALLARAVDRARGFCRGASDPDIAKKVAAADAYKVKGNIHWVSAAHAYRCEVRLYDRLFREANPGAGGRDYLEDLNPNAKQVIAAQLEPALRNAKPEERFQFERHGYFVADRVDSKPGAPVFNRTVTLKDSWAKG